MKSTPQARHRATAEAFLSQWKHAYFLPGRSVKESHPRSLPLGPFERILRALHYRLVQQQKWPEALFSSAAYQAFTHGRPLSEESMKASMVAINVRAQGTYEEEVARIVEELLFLEEPTEAFPFPGGTATEQLLLWHDGESLEEAYPQLSTEARLEGFKKQVAGHFDSLVLKGGICSSEAYFAAVVAVLEDGELLTRKGLIEELVEMERERLARRWRRR